MRSLRDSSALTNTTADIGRRLDYLAQERSKHGEGERAKELKAEIEATERVLHKLQQVDTAQSLVDLYNAAGDLIASIAEHPQTIGENAAGIYLRSKIAEALEELHIDPSPPISPGPSRSRQS
jgi:hypothetical protein